MVKKNRDKCLYTDINECPYNSRRECPQVKTDCHQPREEDLDKSSNPKKSWRPVVLALVAIVLLMVVSFGEPKNSFSESLFSIIRAGSVSVLAGVLLAWLVDIPKRFDEYTRLISTSLTSYAYLKGLSRQELSDLRGRVTAELYMKDAPKMPRGLINLDNRVCELLRNPYYSVYREIIHCETPNTYEKITKKDSAVELPEGATHKFVRKTNDQLYTIKNPYAKNHQIKANIGLNNYVYLPKNCDLSELFKIEKFQVSIDNGEFVDILPLLKVNYQRHTDVDNLSPDAITYNAGFHLVTKDDKTITHEVLVKMPVNDEVEYKEATGFSESQLAVSFYDNVKVKLKFCLIVPADDNHFTKRLKYAAQSYRLDYYISDQDRRLSGQLLGTLLDQSQIAVNETNEDRHISIEAFDWLLPKNGAFVVSSKR